MHEGRPAGKNVAIDPTTTTPFAAKAGEVLRKVRTGRSLSLRQVTVRSGGRFKPSSVASYERGERQISLERLFELAAVYDVTPERVVAAIADRLDGSEEEAPAGGLERELAEPLNVGRARAR